MHFPGSSVVKNPPAIQETQVQSLSQEDPLEEGMETDSRTPVVLPGGSHGQRSLAGYSTWVLKESDMMEATEHECMHDQMYRQKLKTTLRFTFYVLRV